jgi:2-oxoglutarate dehydrogenase E2 component (dihydrolipoamide succinyltransferase)
MAVEVKVPDMGESVIEATVARWMKQEGDTVAAGEPVVELETDKINLEVGAQQAGVLERIEKQVGDTVLVGDVLARLAPPASQDGEAEPPPQTGAAAAEQDQAMATRYKGGEAEPDNEKPEKDETSKAESAEQETGPAKGPAAAQATPVAQRMALEMGIDLAQVKASGSGGRITKEDLQAYMENKPAKSAPTETVPAARPTPTAAVPAAAAQPDSRETRQRMSRRRQTIARRLVEAQQTAAMLTTFNEIDMSAIMDVRKRRRDGFKERYGVDLGFMSFFVKAVIGGLKAFPQLNAEIQGDEIVLKHYYDIGIAVGAEEGLVVPVVRDADRMNFAEIEKSIRALATKAREGTLTLDDLRGGTFTITNGGVFGSLLSTPIINPPQVGILGMHKFQERPVVVDKEIVIRPMMYVALSYDHRLVDGREAVQFLVRVKELVEDPETMLLG